MPVDRQTALRRATATATATSTETMISNDRPHADPSAAVSNVAGGRPSNAAVLATAKAAIARRRLRDELFAAALFGDPAWDLLLGLFVAGLEERSVSVLSACIGAASPISTSLRHLRKLEQEGQIERRGDPHDARRSFVKLSASAHANMLALFS